MAPPSTPVQVLGLKTVPQAGEPFNCVTDEKDAKRVASHRHDARRQKDLAAVGPGSIFERLARGEQRELKVVLKADQQGTAEAVKESSVSSSSARSAIASSIGGSTITENVTTSDISGKPSSLTRTDAE